MKISVSFFLRDGNRTLGKQLSNFELYLIRVLGKAYLNYISYFFQLLPQIIGIAI